MQPTVFHTPGHKLGRGIPPIFLKGLHLLDATEIPGLDNLHYPEGVIAQAQALAAKAFGADKTFFLVNGSTCGIQASMMALCNPGDKLIIARDCHRSAIAGLMLSGAIPVYIKPEFNSVFGISTVITAKCIEKALIKNPEAVGVYITRPNYYGVCSDIEKIAEVVHSHNRILIVDEAHGAHLPFSKRLPPSSLECKVDICIQSAHKTLPALTQGAYLHVNEGRIDTERIGFYLSLLQSSSPSYIIMAFLDIARAIMQQRGKSKICRLLRDIQPFHEIAGVSGAFKILTKQDIKRGRIDKTRIVYNVADTGKTGFEIENILKESYNIQVEMSDMYNIVCITTVSDTTEDLQRLHTSISNFAHMVGGVPLSGKISFPGDLPLPTQCIEPNKVMLRPFSRKKLLEAAGCISKNMIVPYPPGIPLVCPGEVILKETVEYINEVIKFGGMVNGVSEDLMIDIIN